MAGACLMSASPAATPVIPTRRLVLLLAGLSMFGPFTIDTIFPAFPAMGAELGADKLAMQQTISFYLVAYALMSIVHGPLSDALGRRRVILGGLVVFIAASVGCAMSEDLGTLLVFRVLQGLSAGVGLIVGRAVIRDVLEGAAAQRLMSQVSMIFGVAPAIAPIIGGWLIGWSHWTSIFWFLVAFSALLLVATWRGLPETLPPSERSTLAPRVLWNDYRMIAVHPHFQRLAASAAFNFGALFLFIASAPAFVLDLLQFRGEPLDEQDFAWFFVPMIGGMMLGAWLSGRVAGRMDPFRQVALGFGVSAAAMVLGLGYNLAVEAPQVPWAIVPVAMNSFGIALVFPILTLMILDLFPRHRGAASSMQAFTTLVLNSVLAGVVSPLLSHSALWLTGAAAGLMVLGWGFWIWEARVARGKR